ncbi:bestrophin family protein [Cotesia typhae]|uniref:bestrophin family protein n=1 Tax=Cotesia typhae TaxID=2053667 RepID=UPI003D684DE3
MTISYASEVPNGSSFGCFWRILRKWRGSVYKLIWRELLVYLFLYYLINLTYRYVLNEEQQRIFEKVRYYFGNSSESIPMSFVLGFYVSLVVKRWWDQYKLLPWPDNLALFISAAIPGNDERGRLMRRNIVRYAVLAYVITLQRISLRVKRRFPTLQHIVDVGLMMESEKKIFEMMNKKAAMSKYWMPLVWATNIINRARKEALITSDHVVQTLLVELSDIRKRLGALIGYDTVCVPLVYTQVVTLSLYAYFFSALLGRQFVVHSVGAGKYEEPDMYFPVFTTLQFCFYVGWLKVAEVLINPFGEDDDDIELNWLIDRHIKASYMIVDEMHEEHPELLKDQYWDEVVPKDLPYTVASEQYRREEPKGSAEHYKIKESDALYANVMLGSQMHSVNQHRKVHQDDVYADYESVDTPLVERRKNWLQRQINRMGSVRSSSTTYSSNGGFFTRNRHNSVYSSPENGVLPQIHSNSNNKPSFYDRMVGRKSMRSQRMSRQGTMTKLNSVPVSLKNRPRIPTPDVTKEVVDREQRLALSANNTANIGAGVVGVIPANGTYSSDVPTVVHVVLSPIAETENNQASGKGGTAALAQAVLSPTLTSAGIVTPVTLTPVTMSQLTQLGIVTTASSPMPRINNVQTLSNNSLDDRTTLTEVINSEDEGSTTGSSINSQSTATTVEQQNDKDDELDEENDRSTPMIGERQSPSGGSHGSTPTSDSYNERSAILMSPDKLSGYIVNPVSEIQQKQSNLDARGRRSTSLPCPPASMLRDDRSNSLPHSPAIPAVNKHVNPVIGGLNSLNLDGRQRTGSVGRDLTRSRIHEPHRRISTPASTNSNILAANSNVTRQNLPDENRGEVYV